MAPMPHWASKAHFPKICPNGFPWEIIFLKLDCFILGNLEVPLIQNQPQLHHQLLLLQCQNMPQLLHHQLPLCQSISQPHLKIMILTVPLTVPQLTLLLHPNPFITPSQPKPPMSPCPLKYPCNQPTNLMCPHQVMEPPLYWDNILNLLGQ